LCIGQRCTLTCLIPVKHREKVKLSECRTNFCRDRFSPADCDYRRLGFVKFGCCLGWFTILDEYIYFSSHEDIPFHAADQWQEVSAQLSGTVHCDYPRWVEVLCHDINVHIPTTFLLLSPPIICGWLIAACNKPGGLSSRSKSVLLGFN